MRNVALRVSFSARIRNLHVASQAEAFSYVVRPISQSRIDTPYPLIVGADQNEVPHNSELLFNLCRHSLAPSTIVPNCCFVLSAH